MIECIQLLRNVGQFDSVNAGSRIPLAKLTLLYAENGRGKTTLASIFRSLGTGETSLITERQRLSAAHPPHIVLNVSGRAPFIFQNGAWSANFPRVAVFDDTFVAQNVCSGIEIETEHRQNLHELILGAQGCQLSAELQTHVAKIEEHNRTLRSKAEAIPSTARGTLTADAFCALRANPVIAQAVQDAERNIAAAQSANAVQQEPGFAPITLPAFEMEAIETLLKRNLPELEAAAAARVQAHLGTLGDGAESWVSDGMQHIELASIGQDHAICPFCAQDLRASTVIDHYRAYFSEGYADLKGTIVNHIKAVTKTHGGDIPAAFERAVRVAVQRREFWKTFIELPEITIDTATVARAWKAAREGIVAALHAKQATPLAVR